MTVKYTYKCSSCNHTYLEQRIASQPQITTTCSSCNVGEYEETSVEVISESAELSFGPEAEEESTND